MHPRVLINSKWKTHPRITGVQRYAGDLIDALARADLDFDQAAPQPGPVWKTTLWEQRTLPKVARNYDTLICPANMAPCTLSPDVQLILTIHCLRFHFHPENYPRSFVNWYRLMIPKIIARADTILAVSHTTAQEIQGIYPSAIGKVEVVYPGISGCFTPTGAAGDSAIGDYLYWVFVGNTGPAKNLRVVLDAIERSSTAHRLVLLGVDAQELGSLIGSPLSDRVIPLGHVNDANRVASIFRGASGLLAPSRYESFDLPTIEAMACGCPVIASDTPVHREIAQDAPIYVDQSENQSQSIEWARAMDQLVNDPQEASLRQELGIERASSFCWSKAAREVMDIINLAKNPVR